MNGKTFLRAKVWRVAMALAMGVWCAIMHAQTWTWGGSMPCSTSNEWYAYCSTNTVCDYSTTRYWYYSNWLGATSCDYNSSALFPPVGANVLFPAGSNALLASDVDIRSVSIQSGATFTFSGGALRLRDPGNNDAPGTLTNLGLFLLPSTSSGRFLVGTLVNGNTGTLRHEAGSLSFSGATLQNSGAVEVQTGDWYNYSGTNLVVNGGTFVKTGTGSFNIYYVPFSNSGTVEVQEGTLYFDGSAISGNGQWNVASGGTLKFDNCALSGTLSGAVAGTAQIVGDLSVGSDGATVNFSGNGLAYVSGTLGGSGSLTNLGLFRLPTQSNVRDLVGTLVNGGTGTLRHEASILVFNGATLQNSGTVEVQAGEWYNNSGTNRVVNSGTLVKTGTDSFNIYYVPFSNSGMVEVQEGTLYFNGSAISGNGQWNVASGGTLSLSGSLLGTHSGTVAGTAIIAGLSVGSDGATVNFSGNGLEHVVGTLGGSGTLTNLGLLRLPSTGSSRDLVGTLVNGGTLRHEAGSLSFSGATLQNGGTVEVQAGTWSNNSGTNLVVNGGTVVKTGTGRFDIYVPFSNSGTVEVQEGTLYFYGSAISGNGQWNVASGGTLKFDNCALSGTLSGAVAGTAQIVGDLSVGSDGATVNFSGNGLAYVSGTLSISGTLTNAGLIRLPAGSYGSLVGTLVNGGTGTLRHEAGSLSFSGATLQNGGTVEVQAGDWFNNSGTNLVVNSGTVVKRGTDWFYIYVPLQSAGLIALREGSLWLNSLTQTDGETRIYLGRTLSLSNPMTMQGGKLTGAGTLSGNLNNTAGTIAPGIVDTNDSTQNPLGILTAAGNLTLGSNAVLEIELGGMDNSDPANPQYDRVVVSGSSRTVQLDGTLGLKGRSGYLPSVGDTFDVLVRSGSWSRTGTFSRVEVDAVSLPCVQVEVRYLADRVQVAVVGIGGSPDVDGNGCVDDSDLLAVLFAFGSTGSNPADINCDGVVDDSDLLSVLFAFGAGC
jgi:hypothetical protein